MPPDPGRPRLLKTRYSSARAGALAAKDPLLEVLAERAEAGAPILGICNGAQVLVEAGLVPGGGHVDVALARNRMPERVGYYTRWVWCRVEATPCVFTRTLPAGTLLPLPVAHGEGRFTSAKRGRVEALFKRWDRGRVEGTADRFRFEALQSRYQSLVELWDRGLRAREEGRPGPFAAPPPKTRPAPSSEPDARVVSVTAFRDPVHETDKLHTLYDSLMDARRQAGEEVVPFHKFAALVKDQVTKLRQSGSREVAFRVAVKDGKVNFTVRGLKGAKD